MSTRISRAWSHRGLAVALLAAVVAGCLDRAVTGPENANGESFAARLVVLDGNSQTGAVNGALATPLRLRVTDVNGSPVEGATVSFALRQGGGSVNPPTVRSGADGSVNATWTLGTTLGSQKLMAILTGQWVIDSVALTATATNGPAARLVVDAGDNQHAVIGTALPAAVSVLVTDLYGNPVPGADVTFRVTTGGGRVDLLRSTSDASGKISAAWTMGTIAGAQSVTTSLASGATASFRAVADAGLPVQIIQESGSGQTGTVGRALAAPVSIRVVDAFGNNVRGVTVTWTAEDGTIGASSGTTDTLGRSQGRWVLGTRAGTQSATVAVSGLSGVNVVAIAQAAVPFQVTLETGDKQTQTVKQTLALPLVARITDQYGNGVAAAPVTWSAASGGGSLLATLATSDNTGRSTAIWTLGPTAGSQLATLSVSGLPLTVFSATGVAATGDSLVIEAGNGQSGTVSAPLGTPLLVRVRDTSGNPVVGTSVVFAIASGGGSVTPSIAVTDANGRAQAAWTLGSFAGPQTATATAGSKSVTFTATGAAAGGGGGGGGGTLTPTQLVLVSGNGQNGNVAQTLGNPIVVQVIDASGIPVTGVNVTWTLAAGNSGGFASPTVSRTDGNGNASLLWTLGSKVGLQQVTASATGVPSISLQATAQIGSSGALVVDNGNGQTGAIGATLPTYLRVLVVDQSGTGVTAARVNWSVVSGGGTLSRSSGTTNTSGLDSLQWTLGTTAGSQSVSATVTGVGSVTFTATAGGSVVVNAGNGQSGAVNTQLASDFQVKVIGASGAAIPGVTVTWAVTAGGGLLSKSTGITDAGGLDASRLTLGASVGTNTVTATVAGLGSVSFTATATTTSSPPSQIVLVSGNGQSGSVGQPLASPVIVKVLDAIGNAVSGVDVSWTVVTGGGSRSPVTSRTDATGQAQTLWTLGSSVGTQTIRASVTGLTSLDLSATATVGSAGAVIVQSGNNQTGTIGATLGTKVYVLVVDQAGNPVTGARVNWAVTTGGGTISQTTGTTNALGLDSLAWTLGTTAGAQTVTATVTGVGAATFTATATGTVTKVAGDNQTGGVTTLLPAYLVVKVTDASGVTAVPNITVNWAVASGGGTLSKSQGVTSGLPASLGRDSVQLTLGASAGSNTVTATVTGVGTVTFTATAGGSVNVTVGNDQTGNVGATLAQYLVVTVKDPAGTAIPGVTVNWAVTSGGGTLSKSQGLTSAVLASLGRDSLQLKLGPNAGANSVTATVAGLGSATFNAVASTVASTPASIVKISGDGQFARSGQTLSLPIIVEVRDAAGNPLASVPVTNTTYLNRGAVTPSPILTDASGRASLSWKVSTNTGTAVQIDTAYVTAGGLAAVKFVATVRPQLRVKWVRGGLAGGATPHTQIDSTGTTLRDTLEVQVYDPSDNGGAGGYKVLWATSAPDGVDGLPVNASVFTDNNGKARNLWMLRDKGGNAIPPSTINKRMVATVEGDSIGQVEFLATVIPGRAVDLARTTWYGSVSRTPAGATVDSIVTATVKSTDSHGNPRAGDSVTFTPIVGSGTVSPTYRLTTTDGTASISWTPGTTAGYQSLVVTGVARVKADSGTVTDTMSTVGHRNVYFGAGVVASMTKTAGDAQSATAGSTLATPITVTVKDSHNNLVGGATVTFIVASGGGSVSSASVTTGAGGQATILWTMGTTAGANALIVSSNGVSQSFTATGTVGPAASLVLVSGDQQTATKGTALPLPITVKVTDANGNAVAGTNVTFAVTGGGGSLSSLVVASGADGKASTIWTIGPVSVANSMTAAAVGVTVTITATGTP